MSHDSRHYSEHMMEPSDKLPSVPPPTCCSKSESKTPRTDALLCDACRANDDPCFIQMWEHAEQLEKDLAHALMLAERYIVASINGERMQSFDEDESLGWVVRTLNPVVRGATESRTSPPRCSPIQ